MLRVTLLVLLLAMFSSAIAVIDARHESRKLFVQLQLAERQRDQMNEEWGRLQLEQATWATHGRIERLAREKLDMVVPPSDQMVLVTTDE